METPSLESFLSRNAERFFGSRGPNPRAIASAVAEGALLLGARACLVTDVEGWWYVCADIDWLDASAMRDVDEETVFDTCWGFPEAGTKWHRSEVFCRVYSDAAFSVSGERIFRVKGSEPTDDQVLETVKRLGDWRRVIGFRFTRST